MKDLLLKRRDTRTLTSRDQFYHKHSAETNLVQSFLRCDHKFLPLNETAALMTSKCNLAFPDVANTMQKTLGIFSLPRLHFPRPSTPPSSTQNPSFSLSFASTGFYSHFSLPPFPSGGGGL